MERTANISTKPVNRRAMKEKGKLAKVKDWLLSCLRMCKRIVWPKASTVAKNFVVVLCVAAALVLVTWGLDYVFTTLMTLITSLFAG